MRLLSYCLRLSAIQWPSREARQHGRSSDPAVGRFGGPWPRTLRRPAGRWAALPLSYALHAHACTAAYAFTFVLLPSGSVQRMSDGSGRRTPPAPGSGGCGPLASSCRPASPRAREQTRRARTSTQAEQGWPCVMDVMSLCARERLGALALQTGTASPERPPVPRRLRAQQGGGSGTRAANSDSQLPASCQLALHDSKPPWETSPRYIT